jgi:hypothetical protein
MLATHFFDIQMLPTGFDSFRVPAALDLVKPMLPIGLMPRNKPVRHITWW